MVFGFLVARKTDQVCFRGDSGGSAPEITQFDLFGECRPSS
jgi:hypothetical protein